MSFPDIAETNLQILCQLFGSPKVNFGPLTRSQPHSPYVTHHYLVWPTGHWKPCDKVGSKRLGRHSKIWSTILLCTLLIGSEQLNTIQSIFSPSSWFSQACLETPDLSHPKWEFSFFLTGVSIGMQKIRIV